MGLHIQDEAVDELAGRLATLTGKSKAEAVRDALEWRLAELPQPERAREAPRTKEEVLEEVRRIQERARAMGIGPDGSDDKELMDDLSGGL